MQATSAQFDPTGVSIQRLCMITVYHRKNRNVYSIICRWAMPNTTCCLKKNEQSSTPLPKVMDWPETLDQYPAVPQNFIARKKRKSGIGAPYRAFHPQIQQHFYQALCNSAASLAHTTDFVQRTTAPDGTLIIAGAVIPTSALTTAQVQDTRLALLVIELQSGDCLTFVPALHQTSYRQIKSELSVKQYPQTNCIIY